MMIRKSGLVLVVIVPLVAAVGMYVFRNAVVSGVATVALERMLDAEVELDGVEVSPFESTAVFERLRIVNSNDPSRYLLVAGPARFDLVGLQLFARKLVIDEMRVDGLQFDRPRPGWESASPSPAPKPPATKTSDGSEEAQDGGWSIDVPLPTLNLDALEQELDIDRITGDGPLASERALDEAESGSASRITELERRYEALNAQQRLDAIQAKVNALNLETKDPTELRAALKSLDAANDELKTLRAEAQGLARDVRAEPGRVKVDIAKARAELDADVDAALRLANLGGLNTEQVGALIFGPEVLERFNWVLEQIKRVREMMAADSDPAAQAPRRSGRWIAFPVTARAYPSFLVEKMGFSGAVADSSGEATREFSGTLTGLSSNGRVYGKPVLLAAMATGNQGETWRIDGAFDHREAPGRDLVVAKGRRVQLGALQLKGGSLPERAVTRDAEVSLKAGLSGRQLKAELRLDANQVRFEFGAQEPSGTKERAIRSLFSEFDQVTVQATLGGTLSSPKLRVSSSIDEAFSRRMKGLVGERRAQAEARVRARLTERVNARQVALEGRLASQRAGVEAKMQAFEEKMAAYQQELDRRKGELEQRAKGSVQRKPDDLLKRLKKR